MITLVDGTGAGRQTAEQVLRGWVQLSAEHLTEALGTIPRSDPSRVRVKELTDNYRDLAGLLPLGRGA